MTGLLLLAPSEYLQVYYAFVKYYFVPFIDKILETKIYSQHPEYQFEFRESR